MPFCNFACQQRPRIIMCHMFSLSTLKWRKKQKVCWTLLLRMQEFNTADLKRGMVALIRTVPDNTQEWDRPWSLGRLLKVYPLRKKVDVLWLKPMQGGRPHKKYYSSLRLCTFHLCWHFENLKSAKATALIIIQSFHCNNPATQAWLTYYLAKGFVDKSHHANSISVSKPSTDNPSGRLLVLVDLI